MPTANPLPNVRAALCALALFSLPLAAQAQTDVRATPAQPLQSVAFEHVERGSRTPGGDPVSFSPPPPEVAAFSVGYDVSYHSIDIAVDAAGGLHAVYALYAGGDGSNPVFYAYCPPTDPAACGDLDGWTRTAVDEDMYFLQLEVTADGRPRLLTYQEDLELFGIPVHTTYRYSECNQDCTSSANWSTVDLWTTDNGGWLHSGDFSPHTFALDAQGRPRFIHTQAWGDTDESYFAGCDQNCTSASNWWRRRMPAVNFRDDLEQSALQIAADGSPRVLTTTLVDGANYVLYLECEGTCDGPSDWTVSEPLVQIAPDGYCGSPDGCFVSLDLDAQSRPRMAIQGPETNIVYGWCDDACDRGANWFGTGLSIEGGAGYPTLALDPQGLPRFAYQTWGPVAGLGYAWCSSDCEGAAPMWAADVFDPSSTLQEEFPIPPISETCLEGDWQGGFRPSLAFDAAGNPHIAHDAEHLVFCTDSWGNWSYEARWWTSRIVSFPQPGLDTPTEDVPGAPAFTFDAGFPNPFRSSTTLRFQLPAAEHVRLAVYDVQGRLVETLVDGQMAAGEHTVPFDGGALAPGLYVATLRAGAHSQTQRLVRTH